MNADLNNQIKESLYSVIIRILTPLIGILLRNGITFHVFAELAKQVYVRVASKELVIPGKKQTITRIATITGLTRKDVGQIKENPDKYKTRLYSMQRHNRAARVLTAWIREQKFQNKRGQPASLTFDRGKYSFAKLVKLSGADIPPRTILNELLRSGTVAQLSNGKIALLTRMYVPKNDNLEKIAMLGTDVRDLINTINHNLTCDPQDAFYQRKTIYDNIPADRLAKLREKLRKRAQEALEDFDREMAASDRDSGVSAPSKDSDRMLVGMNLYYFEEKYHEPEEFA